MAPALVSYHHLIDTHSAKNSKYNRCKDAQQCDDTSSASKVTPAMSLSSNDYVIALHRL